MDDRNMVGNGNPGKLRSEPLLLLKTSAGQNYVAKWSQELGASRMDFEHGQYSLECTPWFMCSHCPLRQLKWLPGGEEEHHQL